MFSCSLVSDSLVTCVTHHPWTLCMQGFPILYRLPEDALLSKLMSIESVIPSSHLLCCPLLFLPSIFLRIRDFTNELALCIRWPKYWSFSFSISPSNEYSGLISFRIDWFDLIVQGTLKNLLKHHSSYAPILRRSAYIMVQLSYPYMTTGKTSFD